MGETALARSRGGGKWSLIKGILTATPQDVASGLLALLIFVQVTALGANDQLLQSYAAFFNIAFALIILNWLVVDQAFWKRTIYPFVVLGLGLLWACLPVFATIYDLWSIMPGSAAPRPVPDLQMGGGVRYVSQMALLLSGAIIGYKRGSMRSLVDWLFIFGVCNLVIGLLLRWVDPQHVWGMTKTMHEFRFTGTLQNANATGAILGFLAILAVGRVLSIIEYGGLSQVRAMRGWMVFYGLCTFAFLGGLLITVSRTAILFTLFSLCLLFVRRSLLRRMGTKGLAIAVVASIGSVIVALLLAMALNLPIVARMGQVGPDSIYRAEIYARFWHLYLESPLFGYGLNSFADINLTTLESAKQARDFSYINAAHNQVLQLLLVGGWPFLLAHIAAIALIVRASRDQSPFRETGLFSIWLGLLTLLACSMTDIALTVPAILSLAVAVSGHIWGRALRIKLDAISAANKPKSYYSRRKREKEAAAAVAMSDEQADLPSERTGRYVTAAEMSDASKQLLSRKLR
jgi:O-antigen ligase